MPYTQQDHMIAGNHQAWWEFDFYYDGETAYTSFADRDNTTPGSKLHTWGMVSNSPTIRRSIDLVACKAKVSNLTIELSNSAFGTGDLWDELNPFSATRKYLNRKVVVKERSNAGGSLTRYTGRARDIKLDRKSGKITITVEPNQPWDFISIPNVQAASGRYFPEVWGDYLYNPQAGYCQYRQLWPVQVDSQSNSGLWVLMPFATTSNTYRLHYHQEEQDIFTVLEDSGGNMFYTSSSSYDANGEAIKAAPELIQDYKIKPYRVSDDDPGDFTDPENAIDTPGADDSTTYARVVTTSLGNSDMILELKDCALPPYDATAGDYQIILKVRARVNNYGAPGGTLNDDPDLYIVFDGTDVGNFTFPDTSTYLITFTIDSADWDAKKLPSEIRIRFSRGTPNGVSCTCDIYDVRCFIVCQVDPTDLADAKRDKQDVKWLYCGGDGPDGPWTSGPSPAATLPEIHRSLLITHAGLSSGTPTGFSSVNTARTGWIGRLWLHEPEELRKVLERCQYEGQFIFDWDAANNARYIAVKSSYSSGDVEATLNEDMDTTGIEYSHTPFTELVTQQEIKYQRHPADDSRYLASESYTNTTARTAWNIQTKENIETVELDYLVASADDFAEIRDAVIGNVHPLIQTTITTPEYWRLTTGDIIQIENDSNYYMIVEERRKVDGLSIEARRVG